MIPSPAFIDTWRKFTLAQEAAAANDPDLKNKAVAVLPLERNDPEFQTAIWGPEWAEQQRFGNCSLCRTRVIVRPIFEHSILICTDCMPAFVKASESEPQ